MRKTDSVYLLPRTWKALNIIGFIILKLIQADEIPDAKRELLQRAYL